MVENGRKWWKIDFRVFPVMAIKVTRQAMAGNGRKWWKMDFRGKMVENGFPRVSRHSPTTYYSSVSDLLVVHFFVLGHCNLSLLNLCK